MSEMKTIKGKVEFCVISAQNIEFCGKPSHKCDVSPEDIILVNEIRTVDNSFYLSTITEKQASLLVDFDNDDNYKDYLVPKSCYQLKTAKESLFSLLKANAVKCKITEHKPEAMLLYTMQRFECTADEMWRCREYNELPDDYLLIIK